MTLALVGYFALRDGKPWTTPGAGLFGPKVMIINESAGSGGDALPYMFQQRKIGPLVGTRTWGGLVKSSVHYALVDGGAVTAPDNAVFDPINNKWIAENEAGHTRNLAETPLCQFARVQAGQHIGQQTAAAEQAGLRAGVRV